MTILAMIVMAAGVFFLAVSALGLLRFPDFYTRLHAVGKSETLGAMLVLGGLAILSGWQLESLKILLILVFVAVANPTATHAVLQAALFTGLEPWTAKTKPVPESEETP